VVKNDPRFTLPCYSAEKGIYLGRNVVIERGAEIKPSALLCDNVWLKRNVSLDGDVIIGAGSFVGEGARLKNTVVCPDTYIGAELDFENKIVAGNRIIDLETQAWTEVEEPGVVRPIGGGLGAALKWLWRFLLGRSCGGGRL
jgi:NDP-sugar pyrophosphorylase family protein